MCTSRRPQHPRRAPQHPLDRCRQAFHGARPPEALDRQPPAAREASSPHPRPATRPPLEDPDRVEGRDVSAHGGRRWHRQWGTVALGGAGEDVGLEDIDEGVGHVDYGPLTRGRLRARQRRSAKASVGRPRHR